MLCLSLPLQYFFSLTYHRSQDFFLHKFLLHEFFLAGGGGEGGIVTPPPVIRCGRVVGS